jgi:hypothetical protein
LRRKLKRHRGAIVELGDYTAVDGDVKRKVILQGSKVIDVGLTNAITVRRMECDRITRSSFSECVRVSINRGIENPATELGRVRLYVGTAPAETES